MPQRKLRGESVGPEGTWDSQQWTQTYPKTNSADQLKACKLKAQTVRSVPKARYRLCTSLLWALLGWPWHLLAILCPSLASQGPWDVLFSTTGKSVSNSGVETWCQILPLSFAGSRQVT